MHANVCSTCFACSMPQLSPPMDDRRLLHTARMWMIYAATQPVEVEPATPSSFAPVGLGVPEQCDMPPHSCPWMPFTVELTCTPNKCPRHVSPALCCHSACPWMSRRHLGNVLYMFRLLYASAQPAHRCQTAVFLTCSACSMPPLSSPPYLLMFESIHHSHVPSPPQTR